jgi:hypothetical protein
MHHCEVVNKVLSSIILKKQMVKMLRYLLVMVYGLYAVKTVLCFSRMRNKLKAKTARGLF